MKYRDFGNTGLKISDIVFGAGGQGGIVFRPERQVRLDAVRRALDFGINWIDTAAQYGDGESEENLGWILKELGAKPTISTKARIDLEHVGDIPGEIQRSVQASLQRLQMDSVDVLYLHSTVTKGRGAFRESISIDDVLGPNGVVEGFRRLKEQGLSRFFGFTGFGDTECLHQMITSGHFQAVQAYYNLLNPSAGRSVPTGFSAHDYRNLIGLARQHGVGVHCIRILAAGAVAGAEPSGRVLSPGSAGADDLARMAQVKQIIEQNESGTMVQAAIRFGLMNPGVSGMLVGFGQLEHIDEAVAADDRGPLADGTMQKLDQLYNTDFGRI
ncbi:MAG: aldo/keto reductase [Chloroflexi bacterium]|nr:aldo/keto reductase [Chloroflexota bacterium]